MANTREPRLGTGFANIYTMASPSISTQEETMLTCAVEAMRIMPRSVSPVLVAAKQRLEKEPLFRGRSELIQMAEQDGKLSLRGRLPSYYLKQMLQTILRDVRGVKEIDNQVVVDWPPTAMHED